MMYPDLGKQIQLLAELALGRKIEPQEAIADVNKELEALCQSKIDMGTTSDGVER